MRAQFSPNEFCNVSCASGSAVRLRLRPVPDCVVDAFNANHSARCLALACATRSKVNGEQRRVRSYTYLGERKVIVKRAAYHIVDARRLHVHKVILRERVRSSRHGTVP